MNNKEKKVFVGLSGGVDSSVSAYLLKKLGYKVEGVFIKVWHPDWISCQWKEDRRDAMRVCAKLGIPFHTLDLEKEYKKEVIDYMIREYEAGLTPNPDVMCNRYVKFGAFLEYALKNKADFIATGHYARVSQKNNLFVLEEGKDKNKDQSYFLWTLGQKELSKTLFPVGDYLKPEVRKIAEKAGLITATKKDSQGLCFVGKVDMKEFLKKYIKTKTGDVLDINGKKIGFHDGVFFYAIGQRHGFEITEKGSDDKPLYVIGKNIKENTLIVSEKIPENPMGIKNIEIRDQSWISEKSPKIGKVYLARVRYRQFSQNCVVSGIKNNKIIISFEKAQEGVSLGQSLVIYDNEICLGGGIIERVF